MGADKLEHCIVRYKKINRQTLVKAALHNSRKMKVPNADGSKRIQRIPIFKNELDDIKLLDKVKNRIAKSNIERPRKNATIAVEILLTATSSFFAQDKNELCDYQENFDHAQFNAWYQRSVDWLNLEFGDLLVHADLHLDESTPHIHAFFVPIMTLAKRVHVGYKKYEEKILPCLSASKLIDKRWSYQLHDSYSAAMASFGLVRGTRGVQQVHSRLKDFRKTEHDVEQNQNQLKRLREQALHELQNFEKLKLKAAAMRVKCQQYESQLKSFQTSMNNAQEAADGAAKKLQVMRRKNQDAEELNNALRNELNGLSEKIDEAKNSKSIAEKKSKEAIDDYDLQQTKLKLAQQSAKSSIEFINRASSLLREFSSVGEKFKEQIRSSYMVESASEEFERILNEMGNTTKRYLVSSRSGSIDNNERLDSDSPVTQSSMKRHPSRPNNLGSTRR